MRILYVAKHGTQDNQDEQAIAHALRVLGHEVICVQELRRHRPLGYNLNSERADFCLFHKWGTVSEIEMVSRNMPVCFWYFDMIRPVDNDPTLEARSLHRIDVLPHCLLGFHTDGDWVKSPGFYTNSNTYKSRLRWLMQGADERTLGLGEPIYNDVAPILFTGMVHHGQKRANQISYLKDRYGDNFQIIGGGGAPGRMHGRELANLFASTKIVIAPCGPVTDSYWSNRVYLTLGLGGFLLHPYSFGLVQQYGGLELTYYFSQEELDNQIDFYLNPENEHLREDLRHLGLHATRERNLYRHRCEELIRQVKEAM
jgi:hypothetical protein